MFRGFVPQTIPVAGGANPVFYVANDSCLPGVTVAPAQTAGMLNMLRDSPQSDYLDRIWAEAVSLSQEAVKHYGDSEDQDLRSFLMRVTQLQMFWTQAVIAFIKPFHAQESDESEKNYYMEREWRANGDIHFELGDVHRVILPEGFAQRFRTDFPAYFAQLTFPE